MDDGLTPIERFQAAGQPNQGSARLDTIQHKCATFGPQAHFIRRCADGSIELLAAPCLRWSCDACGPEILRPRLRKELIRAVWQHELTCWVTLTLVHVGTPDSVRLAKRLSSAWKGLRDLYRKRYGHALHYIWLKEIHDGCPHLHLFTQPVDEQWIKKAWHSLTGAYQVKVVMLDTEDDVARRVNYATKSICNDAKAFGTSCGRWRGVSRGIRLQVRPRSPAGSGWRRVKGPIDPASYADRDHRVDWVDRVGRPKKVILAPPRSPL